MHQQPVDPQEHELLDRAAYPEQRHAQQQRAAQGGGLQFVGVDEAQRGDAEEDVDQAQVEDLHDGAVGDGRAAQGVAPAEQFPEGHVEQGEGQAVQAAEVDPCGCGHGCGLSAVRGDVMRCDALASMVAGVRRWVTT